MITDNQLIGTVATSPGSLGVAALLRETRLKMNRDIAVAAATLRIRQPYLQAIEDGRFNDLPGATYAVGFVRGYAEYLGLDGTEIVRRFKQENRDLASRAELVFPSTGSGSGIPTGALVGLAIVGALLAYGVWYWLQDRHDSQIEAVAPLPERLAALIHRPVGDGSDVVAVQDAPQRAEAPPPSAAPAPIADAPPPPPATEPAPVEQAPPPPEPVRPTENKPAKSPKARAAETAAASSGDNPSQAQTSSDAPATDAPKPEAPKPNWRPSKRVVLRAEDTCWIKIRDANGQMILSRLLKKGDVFSPPDRPGLEMTVGSAGALTVLVDGKEIPSLGPAGVVKRVGLDPDKLDKSKDSNISVPANNND